MPLSALGYIKDGRVRPEQSVKQAAADAASHHRDADVVCEVTGAERVSPGSQMT